jgi:hypothetical protein
MHDIVDFLGLLAHYGADRLGDGDFVAGGVSAQVARCRVFAYAHAAGAQGFCVGRVQEFGELLEEEGEVYFEEGLAGLVESEFGLLFAQFF